MYIGVNTLMYIVCAVLEDTVSRSEVHRERG